MQSVYVCPKTKKTLSERKDGLLRDDGVLYPFIFGSNNVSIPNFVDTRRHDGETKQSLDMYNQETSAQIYKNFLGWLFQTFNEDELSFRGNLIAKLKLRKGSRVLVTGCGLGDDIRPIMNIVGLAGEVYANDLAAEMVVATAHNYVMHDQECLQNIFFSVCDAHSLPFSDDFFDGAFHFGGINLFDNIEMSIKEMERVVKPGGRVVFGDEGVAPWLRSTEYAQIVINNNSLWAATAPIDLLPENSIDVHLSWVLGNCFYVIDFEVSDTGPFINIDVPHRGNRGGSMRTRYFNKLKSITEGNEKFVSGE